MLKRTYLKLVEMQEEQARRHLDEVRSIHSEMRGYKHDFHHHLQALKGQLEAGEVERAIAYITELDRSLQSVDTLLKTGNVTVDAILSAKLAQARADGIAVTVDVNLPDRLTFSDLELSIVIGNLLDNAIEACREAQGEKFIRLSMRIKGKMLYFSPSERRRKPKNEDRLPVPDGKIRRARLRPAPRGGHFGAAWRLGQIQQ